MSNYGRITESHRIRFTGKFGSDARICDGSDCPEPPQWFIRDFPGAQGTTFYCTKHYMTTMTERLEDAKAKWAQMVRGAEDATQAIGILSEELRRITED